MPESGNTPGQANQSPRDPGADSKDLLVPSGPGRYLLAHFEVEIGPNGKPVELGHGAMGVTYKAMDTLLRRPVALKVISSRLLGSESLKHRFIKEARAAASLRHPNIASVFYLGSNESSYFYAMELVTGKTLEEIIATQGPLNLMVALDITAQVGSALAAAHQAGLVHRDIKPANLIVSFDERNRPTVKVIDFGLVKVTAEDSGDSSASEPGVFLGTPRYASPEQFNQGQVDIRSDIYALGVTLWQMLTKTTPFSGSPSEVAAQHLQAPLPIGKLRHLPQPVVSLLTHLLEKDPSARPQTPEEFLTILKTTARALGTPNAILPPEHTSLSRTTRWTSRLRRKVYLAGVALFAGGILTILAGFLIKHPSPTGEGKSVAVLPFDNIGDADQEYLSDGLTSEVIFQLSGINDLRVISRDSVLQYKIPPSGTRKTLRQIGDELGVSAVLESSIQRIQNRLNIVCVLYDAKSARRLWGSSYDRELSDVFAIQRDLAEQIASALHASLTEGDKDNLEKRPTGSAAAYELYLRGRAIYELRRPDTNDMAVNFFKEAIEHDPKFTLAYTSLADAYALRTVRFGGESFWLDSAIDLCREAITIDPKQVRGYTELATCLDWKGDADQISELIMKALELAPNDENSIGLAAMGLLQQRRFDESYVQGRKYFSISPRDPWAPTGLAELCAGIGDKDLAEKWMKKAIGLTEDANELQMRKCQLLIIRGEYQSALENLTQLPLDFKILSNSVLELVYDLNFRLGRWNELDALARAQLAKKSDDAWALLYLANVEERSGHSENALEKAREAVALREAKPPPLGALPFWRDWALACGYRLLGDKAKAYEHLTAFLAKGDLVDLPLGRDQPWFDLFANDQEFLQIMSDMNRRHETARKRIREVERRSPNSLL